MILSIKTTGFSHDSSLISIGIKTASSVKFWNIWDFGNESELIGDFIKYFTDIDDKIVIGFNILKFDIPFLLLKSMNLPAFDNFFRKINFSNITDLFAVLTFMNKGVIKGLDYYCRKYNIQKDFVSDNEMTELHKNREHESFEKNLSGKLNATNELFAKLFWGKE